MPPLAIRWATAQDIVALARVINAAYRVEDFFKTGDRTTVADLQAVQARPGSGFLVIDAAEDGDLVGAVLVEVSGSRGYLGMLSVAPAHQGEGLGRMLVEAVVAHCRATGCSHIDLTVVNLRTELPPLYQRFGFAPSGSRPFPAPDELSQPAHLLVMTKVL